MEKGITPGVGGRTEGDAMPAELTKERRSARSATPAKEGAGAAARPVRAGGVQATLEQMFSGRRRARRSRRILAVEIRTSDGRVCRGLTVDISRGGALLDLNDGRLFPPGDPLPLVAYAGIARDWLREGFEVTFRRGGVRAQARIVRAVTGPKKGAPPFIGCRFSPALPDEACRRLGVEDGGDAA
jgi:hypothetical protein